MSKTSTKNTGVKKSTATKEIEVTRRFAITYDRRIFTKEFMEHFRRYFYDFKSIDEHMDHIANCIAMGIVRRPEDFLEGYGKLNEFGVSWKEI